MKNILKDLKRRDHKRYLGGLDVFKYIGPGLLVTVGFIDPGNWASNFAAGSEFGYSLLWVVTLSTIMLIVLQHNVAHLGIVTGLCLSEAATKYTPKWVSRPILGTAVLASISTSLAEILGGAIALEMLFDIPIIWGAVLTTVFVVIMLFTNSYKKIERSIIAFVSVIGLSFIYELFLVKIDWPMAVEGWVTPAFPKGSMLIIMSVINESIPPEANMTLFRIENLAGGIAVFGLSFVMLFTTLTVSKDRSGAFLVRLYATPMNSADFIAGYALPCLLLAVLQSVISFAASLVVASVSGSGSLTVGGSLLSVLTLIPGAVFFIAAGVLFGALFNEKAAPGLCSVIISLASLLGGVWFDCEAAGGAIWNICRALPFYHCVKAARMASVLDFNGIGVHLLIVAAYAVVFAALSAIVFHSRMKADLA